MLATTEMETLTDLLDHAAAEHGDRTALTIRTGLRDDAWSYRRLSATAAAVAAHLSEDIGLEQGARVVVWGPNCPQLVAAYFGVLLARLVLVPLDPYATPEFLSRVIDRTEAALLDQRTREAQRRQRRRWTCSRSRSTPAGPTAAPAPVRRKLRRSSSRRARPASEGCRADARERGGQRPLGSRRSATDAGLPAAVGPAALAPVRADGGPLPAVARRRQASTTRRAASRRWS